MKQVTAVLRLVSTVAAVSFILLVFSGCGTTSTARRNLAAKPATVGTYAVGSCTATDDRATQETCKQLKEQIQYGLFKRGCYARSGIGATRRVDLKITYFRNISAFGRALAGIFVGKDGLDVEVTVVDPSTGKAVQEFHVSTYNYSAYNTTEMTMIRAVSDEVVESVLGIE